MKTNIFFSRNATFYSLIGFLSLLVASCGSYQNSSYYDTDGIYGNSEKEVQEISSNRRYKEYFSSLQNENNTLNDTIQVSNQSYPSWGSNPTTTSVNVYADPWSMSIGFGFGLGYGYGYPYYGYGWGYPYYGYDWGYPYYGYGYPYYNYGYPYYGYNYPYYSYGYNNNNYSYNLGRRGSSYSNGTNSNVRLSQNSTTTRDVSTYNYRRNSTDANSTTRNNSSFMTRDYSQSQNNSGRTRTSTNTNDSRNQSYNTTARSYNDSPSSTNYSSGRTSSSNTYSSGSYSSGSSGGSSSGGGRTSGGGGRR